MSTLLDFWHIQLYNIHPPQSNHHHWLESKLIIDILHRHTGQHHARLTCWVIMLFAYMVSLCLVIVISTSVCLYGFLLPCYLLYVYTGLPGRPAIGWRDISCLKLKLIHQSINQCCCMEWLSLVPRPFINNGLGMRLGVTDWDMLTASKQVWLQNVVNLYYHVCTCRKLENVNNYIQPMIVNTVFNKIAL